MKSIQKPSKSITLNVERVTRNSSLNIRSGGVVLAQSRDFLFCQYLVCSAFMLLQNGLQLGPCLYHHVHCSGPKNIPRSVCVNRFLPFRKLALCALDHVKAVFKHPSWAQMIQAGWPKHVSLLRRRDQGERVHHLLGEHCGASCNHRVGRMCQVTWEFDDSAQPKENSFSRPNFLISSSGSVVGTDICSIGYVASSQRPESSNEKGLMMKAHKRTQ
mmetsp:Transcript_24617/g.31824  ORF Transcript_24617/g.31824 Transcript_24617/m.31824 type:complete len:216 (-) Transcript_24617:418-1065(-)